MWTSASVEWDHLKHTNNTLKTTQQTDEINKSELWKIEINQSIETEFVGIGKKGPRCEWYT